MLFLSYALLRWALIVVCSQGRLDAVYHDRYHMISWILLAFCGLRGWEAAWGRLFVLRWLA